MLVSVHAITIIKLTILAGQKPNERWFKNQRRTKQRNWEKTYDKIWNDVCLPMFHNHWLYVILPYL